MAQRSDLPDVGEVKLSSYCGCYDHHSRIDSSVIAACFGRATSHVSDVSSLTKRDGSAHSEARVQGVILRLGGLRESFPGISIRLF
jgi:hypothetical protein